MITFYAKNKPKQLCLFPEIICSAYMVADSPKSAFYRIWIEASADIYTVTKESGIKTKVLDKRTWPFDSIAAAKALYDRRIREKTNPQRKRPRIYTLVFSI